MKESVDELVAIMRKELVEHPKANAFGKMVAEANQDRWLKPEKLVQTATAYMMHIENVFQNTLRAMILQQIANDGQQALLDKYKQFEDIEKLEAEMERLLEQPQIKEKVCPDHAIKGLIELYEKHENEIKEYIAAARATERQAVSE